MKFEERAQFKELLEKQEEVYLKMRDVLRAQAQALNSGDTEKLLELMGEVNEFRVEASQLQAEIDPLKVLWEGVRDQVNPVEREVLVKKVASIKTILADVLEAMNALQGHVSERKDDTQGKIRDMQRAEAARRGYGASLQRPPSSPRFMDRKE